MAALSCNTNNTTTTTIIAIINKCLNPFSTIRIICHFKGSEQPRQFTILGPPPACLSSLSGLSAWIALPRSSNSVVIIYFYLIIGLVNTVKPLIILFDSIKLPFAHAIKTNFRAAPTHAVFHSNWMNWATNGTSVGRDFEASLITLSWLLPPEVAYHHPHLHSKVTIDLHRESVDALVTSLLIWPNPSCALCPHPPSPLSEKKRNEPHQGRGSLEPTSLHSLQKYSTTNTSSLIRLQNLTSPSGCHLCFIETKIYVSARLKSEVQRSVINKTSLLSPVQSREVRSYVLHLQRKYRSSFQPIPKHNPENPRFSTRLFSQLPIQFKVQKSIFSKALKT